MGGGRVGWRVYMGYPYPHRNLQGIVKALQEYQLKLQEYKVSIFVRSGGPNYQEGLRVMNVVHVCRLSVFLNWLVLSACISDIHTRTSSELS